MGEAENTKAERDEITKAARKDALENLDNTNYTRTLPLTDAHKDAHREAIEAQTDEDGNLKLDASSDYLKTPEKQMYETGGDVEGLGGDALETPEKTLAFANEDAAAEAQDEDDDAQDDSGAEEDEPETESTEEYEPATVEPEPVAPVAPVAPIEPAVVAPPAVDAPAVAPAVAADATTTPAT